VPTLAQVESDTGVEEFLLIPRLHSSFLSRMTRRTGKKARKESWKTNLGNL